MTHSIVTLPFEVFCDLCASAPNSPSWERVAMYDALCPAERNGPLAWRYICANCFEHYNIAILGGPVHRIVYDCDDTMFPEDQGLDAIYEGPDYPDDQIGCNDYLI